MCFACLFLTCYFILFPAISYTLTSAGRAQNLLDLNAPSWAYALTTLLPLIGQVTFIYTFWAYFRAIARGKKERIYL